MLAIIPRTPPREQPMSIIHQAAMPLQAADQTRPWSAADADWSDPALRRRALLTVAQEAGKSLSMLREDDLRAGSCAALLDEYAVRQNRSLEQIAAEVERDMKARLSDDSHLPQNQNVLCLSPHPDDDVICCGATLSKMTARGNRVTVAYGVSGSMAVRDKDVLMHLSGRHPLLVSYIEERIAAVELSADEPAAAGRNGQHAAHIAAPGRSFDDVVDRIRSYIFARAKDDADARLLHELKRLVREGEAAEGCRRMKAAPLFLNLPFYQTGAVRKNPVGPDDAAVVRRALQETQPDVVLLTGELNDPHGTHEMCAEAFERGAAEYLKAGGKPFARWRYRGAWDEYEPWQGDYFSIFDSTATDKKIGLILDHISQLDPLFPGDSDTREFYERARDRNRATARQLQALGVLLPSPAFDPLYAEVFQIETP